MSVLQCILFLTIIILINCSTDDIELTTEKSIADKIANKIREEVQKVEKELNEDKKELNEDEKQLKIDRKKLKEQKQIKESIYNTDIIRLNVGGEFIMTTRQTLTKIPKSIFSILFNGRWEHKLQIDQNGNIFFDFNPNVFRHLLDQLQILDTNNLTHFYPPSQPSLIEPFKKMLKKLDLNQLLSLEKKNIITFNIGGQIITTRHEIFTQISNSTIDTIILPSKMINFNNQSDIFLDYNPKIFQHLINQLREESFKNISPLRLSLNEEKISFKTMLSDLNSFVTTTTTTTTERQTNSSSPHMNNNKKWNQNGLTIAGANKQDNQLNKPQGIYVDNDHQYIYIADYGNDRIVEWPYHVKTGQIFAGRNFTENQLNQPTDVILDKKTDSLIICDYGNRQVVRWSRQNGTNGKTIISNIDCFGLTMDNNGDLYVSDTVKHEVRKWKIGEKTNGTIVAGGNEIGNDFNQLNYPTYLFVDKEYSVYVSDHSNHRVMKWPKHAKEGIVVAGGPDQGNSLKKLSHPTGVIVDEFDNIYVADSGNHRIMCWPKGSKEGRIIVGGNGQKSNQFNRLGGLSFDRQGNLYLVDLDNNRVQIFGIDLN